MIDLSGLYRIAEENNITIDDFRLEGSEALAIMKIGSGKCYIAIDSEQVKSISDEKMKLCHEIGHCVTGSFYKDNEPTYIKQKCENRANKWAIEQLIPLSELNEAVKRGHTEIWDLAEYFNVTEDFMRMAVCWYLYGTLETDNYFAS